MGEELIVTRLPGIATRLEVYYKCMDKHVVSEFDSELDIAEHEAITLQWAGLIYPCENHDGPERMYHLHALVSWDEIEQIVCQGPKR